MIVRSAKKVTVSGECSICLDTMSEPKKIVITQCSHAFHEECITFHLGISEKTRNSCPNCRQIPVPLIRAEPLADGLESNPFIECGMLRALRIGDPDYIKAALLAEPHLIEKLYESKANNVKYTLLTLACAFGYQDLVVFLLERTKKEAIDKPNSNGLTALSAACLYGHTQIAKILITAGAEVNKTSYKGKNALWYAACSGKKETLELLVEAGSAVTNKTEDNFTALLMAAQRGHLDAVNYLISVIPKAELKEHVNICASSITTPVTALYMAALAGYKDVVSALISAGANSNQAIAHGQFPLHIASLNGHLDVVEILIAKGAHVDNQARDGASALFCAAEKGHRAICERLLKANANPDLRCREGFFDITINAAMVARKNGHLALAEYIDTYPR